MGEDVREPFRSDRWVRGFVGGTVVVDSRDQLLVWEAELPVPRYLFRDQDIRSDCLVPTAPPEERGYQHPNSEVTTWFDVVVGDRTVRHGAWRREGFDGWTGVTWERGALDHWYEEEVEVFEHPHDPFVHIDALPSSRLVTVRHGDILLAESHEAVLLWETNLPRRYYLPRSDVDLDLLTPSNTESICPYKGFATEYWSVTGEPDLTDVAWSYPEPFFPYRNLAGRIAFLHELLDVSIDGVQKPRSTQ